MSMRIQGMKPMDGLLCSMRFLSACHYGAMLLGMRKEIIIFIVNWPVGILVSYITRTSDRWLR